MKRVRGLAVLMVLLAGCGTIVNTATDEGGGSGVPARVIYGGVRTDIAGISGYKPLGVFSVFLVLDIPMTFGLDSALLPLTVVREVFFAPEPVKAERFRWSAFPEGFRW